MPSQGARTLGAFLFAAFAALTALSLSYPLQLDTLQVHNVDEFAFHGSLLTMHDAVLEADPKSFFAFTFYNYGLGYFVANLLLTFPFLDSHVGLSILLPRLFSSATAVLSLYFIYQTAALRLDRLAALTLAAIVVTMPGFWANGAVFHPDWLMTGCLLGALYFLALDCHEGEPFSRNYWLGVTWVGLGMGLAKVQAIMFAPFFALYFLVAALSSMNKSSLLRLTKLALLTALVVFGLFITTNPYLLHPSGRIAFRRTLDINLQSNLTAHGSGQVITIGSKLAHGVYDYYSNPATCVVLLMLALYVLFRANAKIDRTYRSLAFYCLVYFVYLLYGVNKDWFQYYLSLVVPALLVCVPVLAPLRSKHQQAVLGVALVTQLGYYAPDYVPRLADSPSVIAQGERERTFIREVLADKRAGDAHFLLSPGVGFPFESLHIDFRSVDVIWGPLSRWMFDRAAIASAFNEALVRDRKLARFHTKDFVILKRGLAYVDPAHLDKVADKAAYRDGIEVVQAWNRGELGYHLLAASDDVLIYERRVVR